jgi:hypothetical protein
MLIGYMRVSKADGSQSSDLQRDALLSAGVDTANLYAAAMCSSCGSSTGLGGTCAIW